MILTSLIASILALVTFQRPAETFPFQLGQKARQIGPLSHRFSLVPPTSIHQHPHYFATNQDNLALASALQSLYSRPLSSGFQQNQAARQQVAPQQVVHNNNNNNYQQPQQQQQVSNYGQNTLGRQHAAQQPSTQRLVQHQQYVPVPSAKPIESNNPATDREFLSSLQIIDTNGRMRSLRDFGLEGQGNQLNEQELERQLKSIFATITSDLEHAQFLPLDVNSAQHQQLGSVFQNQYANLESARNKELGKQQASQANQQEYQFLSPARAGPKAEKRPQKSLADQPPRSPAESLRETKQPEPIRQEPIEQQVEHQRPISADKIEQIRLTTLPAPIQQEQEPIRQDQPIKIEQQRELLAPIEQEKVPIQRGRIFEQQPLVQEQQFATTGYDDEPVPLKKFEHEQQHQEPTIQQQREQARAIIQQSTTGGGGGGYSPAPIQQQQQQQQINIDAELPQKTTQRLEPSKNNQDNFAPIQQQHQYDDERFQQQILRPNSNGSRKTVATNGWLPIVEQQQQEQKFQHNNQHFSQQQVAIQQQESDQQQQQQQIRDEDGFDEKKQRQQLNFQKGTQVKQETQVDDFAPSQDFRPIEAPKQQQQQGTKGNDGRFAKWRQSLNKLASPARARFNENAIRQQQEKVNQNQEPAFEQQQQQPQPQEPEQPQQVQEEAQPVELQQQQQQQKEEDLFDQQPLQPIKGLTRANQAISSTTTTTTTTTTTQRPLQRERSKTARKVKLQLGDKVIKSPVQKFQEQRLQQQQQLQAQEDTKQSSPRPTPVAGETKGRKQKSKSSGSRAPDSPKQVAATKQEQRPIEQQSQQPAQEITIQLSDVQQQIREQEPTASKGQQETPVAEIGQQQQTDEQIRGDFKAPAGQLQQTREEDSSFQQVKEEQVTSDAPVEVQQQQQQQSAELEQTREDRLVKEEQQQVKEDQTKGDTQAELVQMKQLKASSRQLGSSKPTIVSDEESAGEQVASQQPETSKQSATVQPEFGQLLQQQASLAPIDQQSQQNQETSSTQQEVFSSTQDDRQPDSNQQQVQQQSQEEQTASKSAEIVQSKLSSEEPQQQQQQQDAITQTEELPSVPITTTTTTTTTSTTTPTPIETSTTSAPRTPSRLSRPLGARKSSGQQQNRRPSTKQVQQASLSAGFSNNNNRSQQTRFRPANGARQQQRFSSAGELSYNNPSQLNEAASLTGNSEGSLSSAQQLFDTYNPLQFEPERISSLQNKGSQTSGTSDLESNIDQQDPSEQ